MIEVVAVAAVAARLPAPRRPAPTGLLLDETLDLITLASSGVSCTRSRGGGAISAAGRHLIGEHVRVGKEVPTLERVEAFLADHHGVAVSGLQPLAGGVWSSAFAYRVGARELVLRVGSVPEGFEMDRAAMGFDAPDLPVPEVYDIGEALGGSYAISARHHGRFLETIRPDESDAAGSVMLRALAALRTVPGGAGASVAWYSNAEENHPTWRRWLTHALVDDPRRRVTGWRSALAADAKLDRLYRACEGRIRHLVEACPERRDLVHGDLLHSNVLIAEDASRLTAVFSWKCSVRGDFLFDVAWCTFWGAWHPGIAEVALYDRVMASMSSSDEPLIDAALRHHCHELQIGATHLGWNTWTGDHAALRAVAAHTVNVLERGPLPRNDAGTGDQ